jgi:hypothetical protein
VIRLVSTVSLLALLVLVLYLPSAYAPERLIQHLRGEHELTSDFWGSDRATRILSRMLDFQATAKEVSPLSSLANAKSQKPIDLAVATQMSEVNARLFNNTYFRSLDTLLALATYRLSALVEGLPFALVFMIATFFDGYVVRAIKAKEFAQHKPEMFAVYVCAGIVTACATLLILVVPVTLPPSALCILPLALCFFTSRAVSHFHRRG